MEGAPIRKYEDIEKEVWNLEDLEPEKIFEGSSMGKPIYKLGNSHKIVYTDTATNPTEVKVDWKVYFEPVMKRGKSGNALIKKVVFHLHQDFVPPSVEVTSPPYELSRIGWGTFDIEADVHCHDGRVLYLTHLLSFDEPDMHSLVPMGLDWP